MKKKLRLIGGWCSSSLLLLSVGCASMPGIRLDLDMASGPRLTLGLVVTPTPTNSTEGSLGQPAAPRGASRAGPGDQAGW